MILVGLLENKIELDYYINSYPSHLNTLSRESNSPFTQQTRPSIHDSSSESVKYVLNTMNFPFLLTSLPLNVITSRLCVVNLPCQLEIEISLLCIREDPLPEAFHLGMDIFHRSQPSRYFFCYLVDWVFRNDFIF